MASSNDSSSDSSVGKFIAGLAVGVLLSSSYVKWGWQKPALLEMPDKVKSSVIAGAVSTDLYDLTQPLDVRLRALEVVAQQRPDEILCVDAEELDFALLNAFYRRRARREARQLTMQWSAYETALEQPALREVLERRYRTTDSIALKQAMLMKAYRDQPFLSSWMTDRYKNISAHSLYNHLREVARHEPALARAAIRNAAAPDEQALPEPATR